MADHASRRRQSCTRGAHHIVGHALRCGDPLFRALALDRIAAALVESAGNLTETAARLDVPRRTLCRWVAGDEEVRGMIRRARSTA